MTALSYPLVWVAIFLLCALHVAGAFLHEKWARIVNFVNIGLHTALIFPVLMIDLPLQEVLVLYMISSLAYTLSSFIKHRIGGKSR